MKREEIIRNASQRLKKVRRALPRSERRAVGCYDIASKIGESVKDVRYSLNKLWALGELGYKGETRARVYWRT